LRRAISILLLLAACKPQFDQAPSQVREDRVLAVRGNPAEARPGVTVTYDVLTVNQNGEMPHLDADWAYCNVPKPLDENNTVSIGCTGNDMIDELGMGLTASGDVPLAACSLFGPDPPPQMPGEPPLRPRDPDVSGGYYQPVRFRAGSLEAFGLERITCALASAGADIAVQFGQEYKQNQNPSLLALAAAIGGGAPLGFSTDTPSVVQVPVNALVSFTAAWPPESVESYPVYDLTTLTLVQHRESMRVSWFATAGSFAHDHTGRDENEMETTAENDWTAPSGAQTVHLWLVLRDSRGGVDYKSYDIAVTP
jgi:hypothetical protein